MAQEHASLEEDRVLSALHRRIPAGRFRPSDEELELFNYGEEEFEEEEFFDEEGEDLDMELEYDEEGRDLQKRKRSLWKRCEIIKNAYLGRTGVERMACTRCRKDPKNWRQYIISCDFSSLCEFCSPQDDSCYTLTHEYVVRPWKGRLRQVEDISYSACGIMHDGGQKVCLDETYRNWGVLNTQCVSVDGVSCQSCRVNQQCGEWMYNCENIEPGFYMDSCDYSINDNIPKSSVFVGFNYAMYDADTTSCFAKDGTPGNLHDRNLLRGNN